MQVSLAQYLQNYKNPEQMLMDILEGLPSKPHEWPNLAAKGYTHYAYSAKNLKDTEDTHRHGIIYQAQADIEKSN